MVTYLHKVLLPDVDPFPPQSSPQGEGEDSPAGSKSAPLGSLRIRVSLPLLGALA